MRNESEELENRITQLRKGILELAIMGVLYQESHYGYSLVRRLTRDVSVNLKEGTVYPILSRLDREGLVHGHWVESSQGPPRKYYSLTAAGRRLFEGLNEEFEQLIVLVRGASLKIGQPKEIAGPRITMRKEKRDE
jgi:PadR family transcriptional regulator PadR